METIRQPSLAYVYLITKIN